MVAEDQPVTYRAIHESTSELMHGRKMPLWRVPKLVAWLGAVVLSLFARLVGQRRFVQPWMVRFAGEHYEIDSSHTRKTLAWSPVHDFERELGTIVGHARKTPEEFHEINARRPW